MKNQVNVKIFKFLLLEIKYIPLPRLPCIYITVVLSFIYYRLYEVNSCSQCSQLPITPH